ncbi:ABC transporter permease [Suttonella indologenes]|uniref:Beta-methylgalactoside transporter inner membrane component n=1 Tax=Suttonella indologenes TaxID=13276 RepID=A0A380MI10_9GAMM|nr:ABC transporter permease [Suttonella indologenes]SUO91437.1 beta-methylgalactoside transporter inner membrane component [Suttonella indologenes]
MLSSTAFWGAMETGLVYSLVAFAMYLSFRVLEFADLTVEGSFPLGAAVSAALILQGWHPWASIAVAVIAGMFAGAITGFLNVRFKIMHLLASILVMYGLYSVNLRIMGRPNLPLLGEDSILTPFYELPLALEIVPVMLFAIVLTVVGILLWWFMNSEIGLAMRATGANPNMARAQGVATGLMVILGISIANGLAALAGGLFAQSRGSADVTLGVGVLVVGLASLIGGEAVLSPKTVLRALLACVIGSIIFRLVIAFALSGGDIGLQPGDINLITTVLMLLAIKLGDIRSFTAKCLKRGQS